MSGTSGAGDTERRSTALTTAHFGQRLKAMRLGSEEKPSIRTLARRVGMSPSRLSRLERSDTPDLHVSTLLRLQEALGISTLEEFFGAQPSAEWASHMARVAAGRARPRRHRAG